jgi:hypothetical protein
VSNLGNVNWVFDHERKVPEIKGGASRIASQRSTRSSRSTRSTRS